MAPSFEASGCRFITRSASYFKALHVHTKSVLRLMKTVSKRRSYERLSLFWIVGPYSVGHGVLYS